MASRTFSLLESLLGNALVQLSRGRQWCLLSMGLTGNAGLAWGSFSSPSIVAPISARQPKMTVVGLDPVKSQGMLCHRDCLAQGSC